MVTRCKNLLPLPPQKKDVCSIHNTTLIFLLISYCNPHDINEKRKNAKTTLRLTKEPLWTLLGRWVGGSPCSLMHLYRSTNFIPWEKENWKLFVSFRNDSVLFPWVKAIVSTSFLGVCCSPLLNNTTACCWTMVQSRTRVSIIIWHWL